MKHAKGIITIIAAAVMMMGVALAEGVDLSGMTCVELVALKDRVIPARHHLPSCDHITEPCCRF